MKRWRLTSPQLSRPRKGCRSLKLPGYSRSDFWQANTFHTFNCFFFQKTPFFFFTTNKLDTHPLFYFSFSRLKSTFTFTFKHRVSAIEYDCSMRKSTVALITKSAFVLFNTSRSLLLICCLQHKWHFVVVHVSVGHVQTSRLRYIHSPVDRSYVDLRFCQFRCDSRLP